MRALLSSLIAAVPASFLAAGSALAHHSAAAFDQSKEVMIEGVVTKWDFRNPHVYITLDVKGPDGATTSQEIEAGAGSVLLPLGFSKSSLAAGEHVVVRANPRRNGGPGTVLGRSLTKDDGSILPLYIAERSVRAPVDATADSIAGTWFPTFQAFGSLGGARRSWTLTDAGKQAVATFDASKTVQADCIPVGAPALMVYPVTNVITVKDAEVVLDIDWMTSQRVVHLDQKEHPADLEPSLQGHSIGHWEGQTLVVDTVGFTPHREGFGFGLASGTGKHLVERFSLDADKKHLDYEVTAEDPEYIVGQGKFSAKLDYRPDLMLSGEKCDVEIAKKYQTEE